MTGAAITRRMPESRPQPHGRQLLSPNGDELTAFLVAGHPRQENHRLHHVGDRQRVDVARGARKQRVNDRQRHRQPDRDRRSLPRRRRQLHRPAQRSDFRRDDVESDPATGKLRHARRGGESRPRDQLEQLRVRKIGLRRRHVARTERILENLRPVDSAPVVAHMDDDLRPFPFGGEFEPGHRILARLSSVAGGVSTP